MNKTNDTIGQAGKTTTSQTDQPLISDFNQSQRINALSFHGSIKDLDTASHFRCSDPLQSNDLDFFHS